MTEKLLKAAAKLFRNTPHFKGKYRIGLTIQKLLKSGGEWNEAEFFIKLKIKFKTKHDNFLKYEMYSHTPS